jgi:[histone H3]-lysine9 N-trimethyltransferase EHMT
MAPVLSRFPVTPKPDPDGPSPSQSPIPVAERSSLMLALTPELCEIHHRELAPSPDDDPSFAHCLRQYQLHLEALAARLRPPSSSSPAAVPVARVPPPPPSLPPQQGQQQQAGAGGGSNSSSKKRARAATEVVRATHLSPADHLRYRALVRRARLTFEALRSRYQRQETSAGVRNRHDLRASSQMLSAGHWLHREVRLVGDIPGVLVGDAFYYRAEICVVGLHTAPQAGIGYIPGKLLDVGQSIATSIVSSGGYLDDEDTGDVLVYTGSGGRQRNRVNHSADQTLERGNLALHNSYQYGVEVRVIRCHDVDQGPHRKVYVYDGLYRVVSSTFGPGKSGHDVCKFKLVRLPGQDELASKTWHNAKLLKESMDARIRPPRYISLDLSKGTEVLRVPVCNKLDDDRSPLMFMYIVRPEFPVPPSHGPVRQHRGCHCASGCGSKCRCGRKNGGGPVYTEDETLVMGRPVVYECGALCGCPMTCVNRVTQRGMKHRLEVFRSHETGWGVRALDLIQPGAFVCEYSGHVVAIDDQSGSALMEGRSIIDPRRFPERWREWGDASAVEPSIRRRQFTKYAGPDYVLDVSDKRNVACYISHSWTPNVFLQFVLRGNEDESFPHLMVFAMETIPPMRELSIDYGIDEELSAS